MLQNLLAAIALVLIIEGIFPLIFPDKWREAMRKILQFDNQTIRMVALIVFSVGVILWTLVQHTNVIFINY